MGRCGLTVPPAESVDWLDVRPAMRRVRCVVNHAPFLILPDVQASNLAFKVLTLTLRRLWDDWVVVYGPRWC